MIIIESLYLNIYYIDLVNIKYTELFNLSTYVCNGTSVPIKTKLYQSTAHHNIIHIIHEVLQLEVDVIYTLKI